jgi:hypothetical protein
MPPLVAGFNPKLDLASRALLGSILFFYRFEFPFILDNFSVISLRFHSHRDALFDHWP